MTTDKTIAADKATITVRQLIAIILFVVFVTATAVTSVTVVISNNNKQIDVLSQRVSLLETRDTTQWDLLRNAPSKLMKTRKGAIERIDFLEDLFNPKNENSIFIGHNKLAAIVEKDHQKVLNNSKLLNPKNKKGIFWHLLVTQDFLIELTKNHTGKSQFNEYIKQRAKIH